jgi:biopolymer transport protein ExbD
MRRFSQRSHLVTLNEINVTPLLDLAFVLLIIFVITTPLIEKGIDLNLPTAVAATDKPVRKEDVRTVDISAQGQFALNKSVQRLDQIVAKLGQEYRSNSQLVIYIRADENSAVKHLVALTDACTKAGIARYSIRTQDPTRR